MVMNGMTILPQEELAREPMVQNLMDHHVIGVCTDGDDEVGNGAEECIDDNTG